MQLFVLVTANIPGDTHSNPLRVSLLSPFLVLELGSPKADHAIPLTSVVVSHYIEFSLAFIASQSRPKLL